MKTMVATIVLLVVAPVMAQTVTLDLTSPQNGTTVTAGATVEWSVYATVSTGDNAGLALVAVDLEQNAGNPELFDLLPGTEGSIDATMLQFSRPQGIANPGEGGATTGYIGVQRGTAGSMNLKQIGGAQNTFGAAGSTMGLDYNVEGGVGQSGAQLVVSGSFTAPSTDGTYSFSLTNGLANVLDSVQTPPAFSPVSAATVAYGAQTITFDVGGVVVCLGDSDCSGSVTFDDIDPFVAALGGEASWINYHTTWLGGPPTCPYANNDCDQSGGSPAVTFDDIDPFVATLGKRLPVSSAHDGGPSPPLDRIAAASGAYHGARRLLFRAAAWLWCAAFAPWGARKPRRGPVCSEECAVGRAMPAWSARVSNVRPLVRHPPSAQE